MSEKKGGLLSQTTSVSKVVLFIINFIAIALLLAQQFSVNGAAISAGAMVILGLCMMKKYKETPTIVYLPLMALADMACLVGIHLDSVGWAKEISPMLESMMVLKKEDYAIVLICIIAMTAFGLLNQKFILLSAGSGLIVGGIFIFESYGQGDFQSFALSSQGDEVLKGFLLCMAVWMMVLQIIAHAAPKKRFRAFLIGFLLLLFFCGDLSINGGQFFAVNLSWLTYVDILLSGWGYLVVGLLLGLFTLMWVFEENLSVDAFGLLMLGAALLGGKLCLRDPSIAQWVILFAVICGTYLAMVKNETHDEICGFDVNVYIIVQFLGLLACIFMLQHGLWMNLVCTMVFIGIFVGYRNSAKKKPGGLWLVFVLGICAEGMTIMIVSAFQVEKIYLMLSMLVVTMGALLTLNMEQVAGRSAPKWMNATVCTCFTVLIGLLVR